jgi:hypothetical protein
MRVYALCHITNHIPLRLPPSNAIAGLGQLMKRLAGRQTRVVNFQAESAKWVSDHRHNMITEQVGPPLSSGAHLRPIPLSPCPSSFRPARFRPARRRKTEVRKHDKSGRYKSMAYSQTFQAVGWRHCLPGGNSLPEAFIRPKSSSLSVSACSMRLVMPSAEGRTAASCYPPAVNGP